MTATVLVVEIVIAGLGMITWIVLLLVGLLGWQKAMLAYERLTDAPEGLLTVAVLAVAYFLGLVIDRSADYVLSTRGVHDFLTRKAHDVAHRDVREMATELQIAEGGAGRWLTYIRGHIRIFRSGVFNCVGITSATTLLVWQTGSVAGALVVAGVGAAASGYLLMLYAASQATYELELAKTIKLLRKSTPPNSPGGGAA